MTVYALDRRGRRVSARPYDPDHDIARDVENIDVVLTATGTSQVFDLSSGAVITLEAARTLPRITRGGGLRATLLPRRDPIPGWTSCTHVAHVEHGDYSRVRRVRLDADQRWWPAPGEPRAGRYGVS